MAQKPKKLLIISHCIVGGGKIIEAGNEYTCDNEREVFELISAGRAVVADTTEAREHVERIADEKAAKKTSKKADTTDDETSGKKK